MIAGLASLPFPLHVTSISDICLDGILLVGATSIVASGPGVRSFTLVAITWCILATGGVLYVGYLYSKG